MMTGKAGLVTAVAAWLAACDPRTKKLLHHGGAWEPKWESPEEGLAGYRGNFEGEWHQ